MKNEFGIEVMSTAEPKRKLEFNQWVERFKVSSMYQKRDADCFLKMQDYDFGKISQKKVGKSFGIIHKLFSFA